MNTSKNIDFGMKQFVKEARKRYRTLISSLGQPDELYDVKDIEVPTLDSKRTIPSRLYIPTEKPENNLYPLVLFVHGGGWVSGDLDTHDVFVRALSSRFNAVILSINYRLIPEYNAIDQINDAYEGLLWLHYSSANLKGDPNKIIAIGDSAGGTIVANLAHNLIRDNSQVQLKAQWLMYPVVNFDFETPSMKKMSEQSLLNYEYLNFLKRCYLGDYFLENDPDIFPYYADHKKICPTLVSVAELDPLTSASEDYVNQLYLAGVKTELRNYPDSQHGFIQFYKNKAESPLGEVALNEGVEIIKKWLQE